MSHVDDGDAEFYKDLPNGRRRAHLENEDIDNSVRAREGHKLLRAFLKIKDSAMREAIVNLVEQAVKSCNG